MVNRNDETVIATGVNGQVVFTRGEFREGYGTTVRSGATCGPVLHEPATV